MSDIKSIPTDSTETTAGPSTSPLPLPSTNKMNYTQSFARNTIATLAATMLDMNAAGVACMLEGREDEALQFFEQGLNMCGVYIQYLFYRNPGILGRLSSKLAEHGGFAFLPSLTSCNLMLQSIGSVTMNLQDEQESEPQRIQQTAFTIYERAFVFGKITFADSCNTQMEVVQHHIASVLLYNLGLLVHKKAITSGDCFLAHELYRLSLFLLEENTIQGLYHQAFDALLLALFNNLGELNGSFYQNDQFGMYS